MIKYNYLWISGEKFVEEMDVRRLVSDFVVPYIAVSLSGQEHDVSVGIVEWKHDTRGTVNGVSEQRLGEIVFIPDGILSVGMPGEARR